MAPPGPACAPLTLCQADPELQAGVLGGLAALPVGTELHFQCFPIHLILYFLLFAFTSQVSLLTFPAAAHGSPAGQTWGTLVPPCSALLRKPQADGRGPAWPRGAHRPGWSEPSSPHTSYTEVRGKECCRPGHCIKQSVTSCVIIAHSQGGTIHGKYERLEPISFCFIKKQKSLCFV